MLLSVQQDLWQVLMPSWACSPLLFLLVALEQAAACAQDVGGGRFVML